MSQSDEKTPEQIAAENDALGPCSVCGGKKSEHASRIHAFTKGEGDLVSHSQMAKRQQRSQPMVVKLPGQGQSNIVLNKLVERLHDKGVLDDDDILFITGIKEFGGSDGAGS